MPAASQQYLAEPPSRRIPLIEIAKALITKEVGAKLGLDVLGLVVNVVVIQDKFDDKSATYTITGIAITGLPNYSLASHFDPAVEIRVGKTSISAQADSKSGDATLTAFQGPTTFKWQKGESIEIEIWDDAINKSGYCLGLVRFTSEYSLLEAVTRSERVPCENHDYKSYSGLGNLRVGLKVSPSLIPPKLTPRK